jgi:hypothetical protein
MKFVKILWTTLFMLLAASTRGQVPHFIPYQGNVTVGGFPYSGTGYFGFSLVNGEGTEVYWSNQGAPTLGAPEFPVATIVSEGAYSINIGDPSITNMVVIPHGVFANPDLHWRIWFSDGTNAFQHLEPDQPIGAAGYAMMAARVSNGAVTSESLALGAVRMENIAAGAVGKAQLSSNAVTTSLAANGGLILTDQTNAAQLTASGFVKIGTVQTEADNMEVVGDFTPAGRVGHKAVWTGAEMLIFGGTSRDLILNSGVRYNPIADRWTPLSTMVGGQPQVRVALFPSSKYVWTGREVIVLGSSPLAAYNPATDQWRPISTANAPTIWSPSQTALWTGSEVLVWGGIEGNRAGYLYSPNSDTWRRMTTNNAPLPSQLAIPSVWTGREFVVGLPSTGGARYSVSEDIWRPISRTNFFLSNKTPLGAFWTGQEMVLLEADDFGLSAIRYNPVTDKWSAGTNNNSIRFWRTPSFAWTGREGLVWGAQYTGNTSSNRFLGFRYLPDSGTFVPMDARNQPAPRQGQTTVWTGSEMIVWGGGLSSTVPEVIGTGGRYRPATDSWEPTASGIESRLFHTAVFTGRELLIWGGRTLTAIYGTNSGVRLDLATGHWRPMTTENAPSGRMAHTAVWTGSEMIIWGGYGNVPLKGISALSTGARYNPVSDTWSDLTTFQAPSPRSGHSAVWAGDEMIIWGGATTGFPGKGIGETNNGARYIPALNIWLPLPTAGAPAARKEHLAFWTGEEMLIIGGNLSTGISSVGTNCMKYNPRLNTWIPMASVPGFSGAAAGVWTGSEVLLHRGTTLVRYNPRTDGWISSRMSTPFSFSPLERVAWDGTEMITTAFGFQIAKYHPESDAWDVARFPGTFSYVDGASATATDSGALFFGGITDLNPGRVFFFSRHKTMSLYKHP